MAHADAAGRACRARESDSRPTVTRRQALRLASVPAFTVLAAGCAPSAAGRADRPAVRWRFPVTGPVYAALGTNGGQVFVSTTAGLDAVRQSTGASMWRFPSGSQYPGTPVASAAYAYVVGSENSCLYAVSSTSGHQRWSFSRSGCTVSGPVVDGGTLYVGTDSLSDEATFIYALGSEDGNFLWATEGTPWMVDGDVLYGFTSPTQLCAFAKATGQLLWSFNSPSGTFHSDLLSRDKCYAVCDMFDSIGGSQVNALSKSTGELIWSARLAGDSVSLCASSGRVYATGTTLGLPGSSGANVISVDDSSGGTVWSATVQDSFGGAILAGRSLLTAGSPPPADGGIASSGGISGETELRALDQATGKVLWRSAGSGPYLAGAPVRVGNTVVVAFSFESLRGVDLETGKTTWSMPLKIVQPPVLDGSRILAVAADKVSSGFSAGNEGALYAISL